MKWIACLRCFISGFHFHTFQQISLPRSGVAHSWLGLPTPITQLTQPLTGQPNIQNYLLRLSSQITLGCAKADKVDVGLE